MAGGRPKKENKRDINMLIRVSAEELKLIDEIAFKCGVGRSVFVRNTLLGQDLTVDFYTFSPICRAYMRFLKSIGVFEVQHGK